MCGAVTAGVRHVWQGSQLVPRRDLRSGSGGWSGMESEGHVDQLHAPVNLRRRGRPLLQVSVDGVDRGTEELSWMYVSSCLLQRWQRKADGPHCREKEWNSEERTVSSFFPSPSLTPCFNPSLPHTSVNPFPPLYTTVNPSLPHTSVNPSPPLSFSSPSVV